MRHNQEKSQTFTCTKNLYLKESSTIIFKGDTAIIDDMDESTIDVTVTDSYFSQEMELSIPTEVFVGHFEYNIENETI